MPFYATTAGLKEDDDLCLAYLKDLIAPLGDKRFGVHYATSAYPDPKLKEQKELLEMIYEVLIKRGSVEQAYLYFARLEPIAKHLKTKNRVEQSLFRGHAYYYLNMYLASNPLEIAKTSRYTHFTGKNELGVFARADIKAGTRLFPYLAGDCAPFTAQDSEMDTAADSDLVWEKDLEEDGEAQQAESSAMGAGRRPQRSAPAQQAAKDFSVYYSTRNRREEFFLGTARFVNHDCDANTELARDDKDVVSVVARRDIRKGDEIALFYEKNYFGPRNESCMCATCERKGTGWYANHSKPSSSTSNSVSSPSSSSDASFSTATTSSIITSTSKLCISTTGAPSSSSSANDHDSLPGTPSSSSSVDPPHEHAPPAEQRRILRNQASTVEDQLPGAVRVLWGTPERREKACLRCKAGIELMLVDGIWVEGRGGCLRCRRHRAIFRLNHPHRPAVDTTLPPFIPSPKLFPPTTILLPPLRPIPSNLDLNDIPALKAEYKLDPESFDATYPGISEGWRKEKKKKRDRQRAETEGRSYKMVLRKGKKEVVGSSLHGCSPFDYITAEIDSVKLMRSHDPSMYFGQLDGFAELFEKRLGVKSPWGPELPSGDDFCSIERGLGEIHGTWAPLEFITKAVSKTSLWPVLARFLQPEPDLVWPVPVSQPSIARPVDVEEEIVDPQLPPRALDVYHDTIDGPNFYRQAHPLPDGAKKLKVSLPKRKIIRPETWSIKDLAVPRSILHGPNEDALHYEVKVTFNSRTVTVGRMSDHHWINLTPALQLLSLTENETNMVYAWIRPKEKEIYSTPAGDLEPPSWVGVWCELSAARKVLEHFGAAYLFENLLLPSKDFRALMESIPESDEDELEEPSGSSSPKSSPLRPSPQKRRQPSPPQITFDLARSVSEENDDADEEEEDFDVDAMMAGFEREKVDDQDAAVVRPVEDEEMEEDDSDVDWILDDDGLGMVKDANDALAPASPILPSASPSAPSAPAPEPVRSYNLVDIIELTSDDDTDDDDEVSMSFPMLESDSDDDVQIVEPDRKGKGKAVDRSQPAPSVSNPRQPRPSPLKSSTTTFFDRRTKPTSGQPNEFAFLSHPQPSSSRPKFLNQPGNNSASSSSTAAGPSSWKHARPSSSTSSPRKSPAASSSSASSSAVRMGSKEDPYEVDLSSDDSDDSDCQFVPPKKKARQSPPRRRPPPPPAPPKVSRSPSKIPKEDVRSSPSDVIDLTSD